MDTHDVTAILATPLFWSVSALGSVFLGIIGNLLTPKVAAFLEKRSSVRRAQALRTKARLLGEILLRSDNPDKLTQTKLDVIYAFLLACIFLLFALILFSLSTAVRSVTSSAAVSIAISVFGFPVLWMALYIMSHGMKLMHISRLVERRNRDLETFMATQKGDEAARFRFLKDWDKSEFGITWDDAAEILKKKPNQHLRATGQGESEDSGGGAKVGGER